ncbi:MAG: hypothetical protein U0835_26770 [Isosphaeraceae bacterium]
MPSYKVIGQGQKQCALVKSPACPNHPGSSPPLKSIQKVQVSSSLPGLGIAFFACTSCLNASGMTLQSGSPSLLPPP